LEQKQEGKKEIKKSALDTFDWSYSNEIQDYLDSVNLDPWYYIYENYVNPPPKK